MIPFSAGIIGGKYCKNNKLSHHFLAEFPGEKENVYVGPKW
jgi:hypothetical protein